MNFLATKKEQLLTVAFFCCNEIHSSGSAAFSLSTWQGCKKNGGGQLSCKGNFTSLWDRHQDTLSFLFPCEMSRPVNYTPFLFSSKSNFISENRKRHSSRCVWVPLMHMCIGYGYLRNNKWRHCCEEWVLTRCCVKRIFFLTRNTHFRGYSFVLRSSSIDFSHLCSEIWT